MSNAVVAAIGLVTLFLAIGSVLGIRAAWKVGQNAQTVTNYRDAANSWEATANALREELAGLQKRLEDTEREHAAATAAAQSTIDTLTVKVKVLEDTVTGRTALADMAASFTAEFHNLTERMARKDEIDALARTVTENFTELHRELHALAGKAS